MAETLGSMIDKLSIKSIREFYISKMVRSGKGNRDRLKEKLKILKKQKQTLLKEIEYFIAAAPRGNLVLKDEKLKLYNRPETMNKIEKITSLSRGIEALTKKNFELWQLEDEARARDVPLSHIGKIKRKIDFSNQQRNDLIDELDRFFEGEVKKRRSKITVNKQKTSG